MIEIIIRGDNGEVIQELDYYDVQHLMLTFEEMLMVYSQSEFDLDEHLECFYLDKARTIRRIQLN